MIPQWRKRRVCYYLTRCEYKYVKKVVGVIQLFEETFYDEQVPEFNRIWYENAMIIIKKHNAEKGYPHTRTVTEMPKDKACPASLSIAPKRKCACGKLTYNYRCDECWAKIRSNNLDSFDSINMNL
jgi:hypothetical protein